MSREKIRSILQLHIPAPAVEYCFNLWADHTFVFKLRKARVTKVGDFSFRIGKIPCITINADLHPYSFLITYIHEVAHLHVHLTVGHSAEAHGDQWKRSFQQLMLPVLTEDVFPAGLLVLLKKHMVNPKASSFSDSALTAALRNLDHRQRSALLLSQIPEGSIFGLRGRWFKKGKIKRTRVMCREINTKKNYLVPADVPISEAQLSFL